jgi:hypothetical protein
MFVVMRKFVLVLSTLAAVFIGLDKIGVTPIAPGTDLRLASLSETTRSPARLRVSIDAGDVEMRFHPRVVLSAIGAAFGLAKKEEASPQPLTPEMLLEQVIRTVEGSNEDRLFLLRVAELFKRRSAVYRATLDNAVATLEV